MAEPKVAANGSASDWSKSTNGRALYKAPFSVGDSGGRGYRERGWCGIGRRPRCCCYRGPAFDDIHYWFS